MSMLTQTVGRSPHARADILPSGAMEYIQVAGLVVMAGGVTVLWSALGGSGSDREAGNPAFQVASLSFYGAFGLLLLREYGRKLDTLLLHNWPLVALTLLCAISMLWSVDPLLTARRAAALVLTTLFAMYLGLRQDPRRLIYLFALALLSIAILSLLSAFIPGVGLSPGGKFAGLLRGLTGGMSGKNVLGRYMGLGTMTFAYMVYFRQGARRLRWFGLALCGLCLLLTGSKTPLASAFGSICALPVLDFLIMPRFAGVKVAPFLKLSVVILGLVSLALLYFFGLPIILELLNRGQTLSGRSHIWGYALFMGQQRPILGAGYRSFWIDQITSNFSIFLPNFHKAGSENTNASVGNGHSGYLDVWLELGWVGVIFFAVFLLSYLSRAFAIVRAPRTGAMDYPPLVYCAALMLFYLAYSYTEKVTLQQSELFWIMLVASYFSLGPSLRREPRLRRH